MKYGRVGRENSKVHFIHFFERVPYISKRDHQVRSCADILGVEI